MKFMLIPLALICGNALACPADGSKDAAAPNSSKSVMAAKATAPNAKAALQSGSTKAAPTTTKVASKSATEPRKAAPL